MSRRFVPQLFLAGVLATIPLLARTPSPPAPVRQSDQQQPTDPIDATSTQVFRSRAELVVLHVNVFDERSDAVPDLPKGVFSVYEDERPQEITFFSGADVPVAAGLLIDNSSSMLTRRRMVAAGSQKFVDSSHPEDELFTILFNEQVAFGLPADVAFTQSHGALGAAVVRLPPGGKTALYDAVVAGLDHLEHASHQKHVLVVLSDGDDNASHYTEKDMLDRAMRSNAIVYTVATTDVASGERGNPGLLKKLARASGGVAYTPRTEREVIEAFGEIAGNIRRGYSIGYIPTNTARDGETRRVKVMVHVPGRPKLSVRSRNGYRAPEPPSTQ